MTLSGKIFRRISQTAEHIRSFIACVHARGDGLNNKGGFVIKNFSDHAANERTYLAWIRTGVTVMAFGFLVEKFDIFLSYIAEALRKTAPIHSGPYSAQILGIGLVLLGICMMITATIRFAWTGRAIDESHIRDRASPLPYVIMVGALVLMGIMLLVYLTRISA